MADVDEPSSRVSREVLASDGWLLVSKFDPTTPWFYGLGLICPSCGLYDKYCYCCFDCQSGEEFTPQSGVTNDASITRFLGSDTQENVMFSQQVPAYQYSVENTVDETRMMQDATDATLEHFFSRPLKIVESEWTTSTSLAFDFDPWALYFENPRVANRIANFHLLRAKLHVRFVINGNGFQYGRALASYLPLAAYDDLSSNAALVPQDLIQASQQPHIFLNPTTSTGGDMILPFFYHKNYLDIPESEWRAMGRMFVRSINDLKHANGAVDKVTVSVFAWAEDVSMSVLTSVDQNSLSPQSGVEDEIDEANTKGMISGPATALGMLGKSLSWVPVIGPYAKATGDLSMKAAAAAKLFGYCRPPVTKDAEPLKPTAASSLALTNVPDTTQKLTLDNKQELSIDPRIAGLGGSDPLDIVDIAKRESYLTSFTWAMNTDPETLLWNARVTPVIWDESAVNNDNAIHLPACAYAALPFKYWTGTMRFRFQVVCSSFHKGRLKVVYDPRYIDTNEYNTNYLDIIDIADKQDFTIEVGNGQQYTLLDHAEPGVDSPTEVFSTTRYTNYDKGNGVLAVYIVNELTTPNDTVNNDIQINVYVSMGDDFQVFVPNESVGFYSFKPNVELTAQSGEAFSIQSGLEVVPESMNTEEPDAPQQSETISMGPGVQTELDKVNLVFTGEAIVSLRTLLKRYNLWRAIGLYDNTYTVSHLSTAMYPYLKGFVAGAMQNTSGGNKYNYCNTVMLHYITAAFSGWRGSVRWKMIHMGAIDASHTSTVFVERRSGNTGTAYLEGTNTGPTFSSAKAAAAASIVTSSPASSNVDSAPFGQRGCAFATSTINPNLEWEMPYYSRDRFVPGKLENYTTGVLPVDIMDIRWYGQGDSTSVYNMFCAAGEDFQTYFFTGCPRIYRTGNPPL